MNRRERRAEQSRARKAFEAGKAAAKTGKLPPGYYELIERMARLAADWVNSQPTTPELRWHASDDKTIVTGSLGEPHVQAYLANSPDAFRLLAWLDEQTGREASLYQATWALRRCRALPMPDGSYYGVETRFESAAMKNLRAIADDTKSHRVAGTACGHCGKVLDHVSRAEGGLPKPGDLSVCFKCFGINQFSEALENVAVTPEAFEALPVELKAQLEEMVALLRMSRSKPRAGAVAES